MVQQDFVEVKRIYPCQLNNSLHSSKDPDKRYATNHTAFPALIMNL